MELSERVAALEVESVNNKEDINEIKALMKSLSDLIKEHMEKEEKDRETLMAEIAALKEKQTKWAAFAAGVTFIVSSLWAVVTSIIYFFGEKHV